MDVVYYYYMQNLLRKGDYVIPNTNIRKHITKFSRWRHFKGFEVVVTDIALDTENNIELVIYKDANDKSKTFARPLSMFLETVSRKDYPYLQEESMPRFTKIH